MATSLLHLPSGVAPLALGPLSRHYPAPALWSVAPPSEILANPRPQEFVVKNGQDVGAKDLDPIGVGNAGRGRQVSILDEGDRSVVKGCALLAAILLAVPLVVVGFVAVRTWTPLQQARGSLEELERNLGAETSYTPTPLGEIPESRMDLFLELRASLVVACEDYGAVQRGFESVASLDSTDTPEPEEVVGVVRVLGGAAFEITPFLARFFELRNDALLAASMGLEEYSYIYAVSYREQLLSERTRGEIFSDGVALSPEASKMLRGCLRRQLAAMSSEHAEAAWPANLEAELERMEGEPSRLVWQDGLPASIAASILPFRERLDRAFCGATAGLEMERGARRALRVALE